MKLGVRNNLSGKVIEIKKGGVMCQVKVEVAGGAVMQAVFTIDSLNEMGIKEGDTVQVLVKAVNVVLAKD